MAEPPAENLKPPDDWVKPPPDGYYWQTQRPLNGLIFLLPAMAFFHICAFVWGSGLLAPAFIAWSMNLWGPASGLLPAMVVVTVLLFQQSAHRFGWSVSPLALAGMLAESVLWCVPLAAMGCLTGWATNAAAQPDGVSGLTGQLAQACGAGIYEEFIFRLVVISLILFFMVDLLKLPHGRSAVVAIVLSALAFSACHFLVGAAAFYWPRFIFLSTAGLLWGGLYVLRGFGIAAGAHIAWDVYFHLSNP
ncbi:MAG: CPBP family intramembrane metalloprotease [Planctomycetes bacterium]|nr:CPBP family intramembrane metalloprotease [Planctomycetota bacterium]